jgi:hypothetical protein
MKFEYTEVSVLVVQDIRFLITQESDFGSYLLNIKHTLHEANTEVHY